MPETTKTCPMCKETKPYTAFHRDRHAKDGLTTYCKPCGISRSKGWNKQNAERYAGNMSLYRERHPEKVKARKSLFSAVRGGQLVRPKACSVCGKRCKPDAHHEDYDRPLDVIWACVSCHRQLHAGPLPTT